MKVSEATTRAKTRTSHDADDQISTAQFLDFIQSAQDRLRRRLATAIPTLYTTTAPFTLSGSTVTIAQPADYLAMVTLEKLEGSRYAALNVSDGLNTEGSSGRLEFRERATDFVLAPAEDAPGTYRLTYVKKSATLTSSPDADIESPPGFDDVIIEWVCAKVRERCEEDPSSHLRTADELYREALPSARKRYGAHVVPGLRRIRGLR